MTERYLMLVALQMVPMVCQMDEALGVCQIAEALGACWMTEGCLTLWMAPKVVLGTC